MKSIVQPGVVISLDAYRERRRSLAQVQRSEPGTKGNTVLTGAEPKDDSFEPPRQLS